MNYKLFIGIDQSKLTFDACIYYLGKHHAQQFENNIKGFKKMMKWINSMHQVGIKEILFCSENTGIYSVPLSIFLAEQQADFWLENPLQIKLSSGLKRGKSDPADAKDIANYCYTHRNKVKLYQIPDIKIRVLKDLISFRARLVKQKTALKTTSGELRKFAADDSSFIVKESKSLIKTYEKKIEAVDEQMLRLVRQDEELKKQFDLVTSVHGIGPQTAIFIIAYTQGFTLFEDWRKFACYCGIAPFKYSSGTSVRGKTRVSHLANKKLKSLLTMCALNTIKKKNEFKDYYDRREQEGKNNMSTINIIRNKLVSRVFAAVKRETPYQSIYKRAA
jgi:transposase